MGAAQVATSSSGMAYRRSGDGPTVVLLHGIPGSAAGWSRVVEQLGPGVDVVLPDLLGFGRSRRPSRLEDLHVRAQADAVVALVDELGLDAFVLVGHDFGGPVAVAVAGRCGARVSGLLVASANVFPDTPVPFPLNLTRLPLIGSAVDLVLFSRPSLWMVLRRGTGGGSPPPDPATYVGDAGQQRSIATIFGGSLRRLATLYAPVEETLRGLSCPVAVVWGDADPFFPPDQARRTAEAARATLTMLPGAGHFLPHERPAELASSVRRMLEGEPARRTPP